MTELQEAVEQVRKTAVALYDQHSRNMDQLTPAQFRMLYDRLGLAIEKLQTITMEVTVK
ncbi:MAG: hypothetical protein JWM85_3639 [Acidimicrobiaceae bacterium]|nr:hypothetical protein [Acidimicrobiaceae bacterium]